MPVRGHRLPVVLWVKAEQSASSNNNTYLLGCKYLVSPNRRFFIQKSGYIWCAVISGYCWRTQLQQVFRGFAASMCGMASPFRDYCHPLIRGYAAKLAAQPQMISRNAPVGQRPTAHQNGKAV